MADRVGRGDGLSPVGPLSTGGAVRPLPWLPNADKLGHAIIFGLPLLLILITVASRRRALGRRATGRFVVITSAVFAAHAVLSELIQHRFYRSAQVIRTTCWRIARDVRWLCSATRWSIAAGQRMSKLAERDRTEPRRW